MKREPALIDHVARALLAKYQWRAIRYAEARAIKAAEKPDIAAQWRLVAYVVRLRSDNGMELLV